MRFGRYYEIQILTPQGDLININPPLTAIIDVDRAAMASQNNCNVTLYNLKESTRNKIYRDVFDFNTYWQMTISAGYNENELYQIFRGNIIEAYSAKVGTEWVTTITAHDAAWAIQNGFINETVTKDTDKKNIIERVIHSLPDMMIGMIGRKGEGTSPRGQTLFGPSIDVLKDQTDGQYNIDGETVYVMDADEVIEGTAFILGDALDPNNAGLLSTPKRREEYLEVETLFAPEIRMNYFTEIHSMDSRYDGQYKTIGVKHSVTFSGAECGDARTSLRLSSGKVWMRLAK